MPRSMTTTAPSARRNLGCAGATGVGLTIILVSSDFDPGRVNQGGMTLGNIILIRMGRVHRRASLIEARKTCRTSQLYGVGTRAKAAEHPLSSAANLRCSAILT